MTVIEGDIKSWFLRNYESPWSWHSRMRLLFLWKFTFGWDSCLFLYQQGPLRYPIFANKYAGQTLVLDALPL